jgi:predicted PurR-regulated permease PerM
MISRRGVEQSIGIAILALIAVGCFAVLRPFLSSIIWAVILTYTTWPLCAWLRDRLGGRTTLAAALMIVAIAVVLVTPFAALGWTMADDVRALAATLRGWFEHGWPGPPEWINEIPLVGARLSARWRELSQSGGGAAELTGYVATLRDGLTKLGAGLANALFEMLLSLVVAFFFYCNGPAIGAALSSLGRHLTGERGQRLIAVVASTVRSVVYGLIGANLLQALLGGLGLWAAGIPGAVLLGFFIFFLTLIPLGPALIWLPAVLWLVHTGNNTAAVLLGVWCVLVFPVLENVVRPYLVKRGTKLPGLLILLGMLGGLTAFGFLGVFLGPAVLALAYTLIEEWGATAEAAPPAEP